MKIIMQNGIQIELFLYLCTDECVSPSLKSPIETWVYMEAQTAAHICGLPICAYRRVFGDTLRGVMDGAVHFVYY